MASAARPESVDSDADADGAACASRVRLNDASQTSLTISAFGREFSIAQDPSSGDHGLALWDGAIALLRWLEFNPREAALLRGARVLELGAGTGLVGIALAAALDARVVLTDLPNVCSNLSRNVADNALPPGSHGSATVLPYAWDGSAHAAVLASTSGEGFSFIIGTDVAYSEALNSTLLQSAAAFARASEAARKQRCRLLFANELRCNLAQAVFDDEAVKLGLHVKRMPLKRMHPEWRDANMLLFDITLPRGKNGESTVSEAAAAASPKTDDL